MYVHASFISEVHGHNGFCSMKELMQSIVIRYFSLKKILT